VSAEVTVEINIRDVQRWVNRVRTDASRYYQRFFSEAGDIVQNAMRETAPVRTGALRDSIRLQLGLDYVRVGPTVPYAAFVEFGTRPQEILPRRAQALRFETEAGEIVYAKRVWHPGFEGRFFVRRAVMEAEPRLAELAKTIFSELYGGR
jgi:HK97 gp10 family phage protein